MSFQTAACVPGCPRGTVSLQGLAVDQVSNAKAVLADGSSVPVDIRSNLIDAQFSSDNPPRQLTWTFEGKQVQRDVSA